MTCIRFGFEAVFIYLTLVLPLAAASNNTASVPAGAEGKQARKMPKQNLVPEIMKIQLGGTVPKSVFTKYDSREIAYSINRKIFNETEEVIAGISTKSVDYLNRSTLVMAFRTENIQAIGKYGFLNKRQICVADSCSEQRALSENQLLGYQLEEHYRAGTANSVNRVRPKYAFFSLTDVPSDQDPMLSENRMFDLTIPQIQAGYGNVFAVFNPAIKERTTFTMTDSLGYGNRTNVHTLHYRADPNPENTTPGTYMEAQIWGELNVQDVEYFIISCESFESLDHSAFVELRKLGKPIYDCIEDYARLRHGEMWVRFDGKTSLKLNHGPVVRVRKHNLLDQP